MEFLHKKLQEFSAAYRQSIELIREIEDAAAISSHNRKYINNMRHSLEHLVLGLERAFANPSDQQGTENEIEQAIHSITNLATDACEYIAGPKLIQAEQRIMRGVSLSERKQAKELYRRAKHHWNQGRDVRTAAPLEAKKHFLETVNLCSEAILSVRQITKGQWLMIVLTLLAVLAALSGWGKVFFFN